MFQIRVCDYGSGRLVFIIQPTYISLKYSIKAKDYKHTMTITSLTSNAELIAIEESASALAIF